MRLPGNVVADDRVCAGQRDQQVDDQGQSGDEEALTQVVAEAAEHVLEVLYGVRPAGSRQRVSEQGQERQHEDEQDEPDVGVG